MQRDSHLDQARQQSELASAEAKALNPHYIDAAGMDDMGDWAEEQERTNKKAVECLQTQKGHL